MSINHAINRFLYLILIFHTEIHYTILNSYAKFLNWLMTSCVVFITSVELDTPEQHISELTSNNTS